MPNPRTPQEAEHNYFVVQTSVANNLRYPPQYAERGFNDLLTAQTFGHSLSLRTGLAHAVFDRDGTRVRVGSTNCDHKNERETHSDQWTRYYLCPDCGTETQEDR